MRRKASTYIGEVFGRLVILDVKREDKRTYAIVKCSCGKVKDTRLDGLQSGAVVSCGCHSLEQTTALNRTHGMYKTPTYKSWNKMKSRCNNEEYEEYYSNISYDESWECFENFLNDMGERPEGCTLDRVDNSLGYFKGNCLWRSNSYQMKNQRKRQASSAYSVYKGVSYDKRYNGCYSFSVTKDYKTLRINTNKDEIKAAMFFNFCTKYLYGDNVELNDVDDLKITVEDARYLQKRMDRIFN
ncbi:putative HNH endonuclease II [Vibrio phage VPMCC14]|nr:putative HNH endonuclease II [Vibrio phage VPMCC14]